MLLDQQQANDVLFLSTPSARRATHGQRQPAIRGHISIHALREEGDRDDIERLILREGFLSTPSARRATVQFVHLNGLQLISIHALREEGDQPAPLP